jgi:hypothetical protein
MKKITTVILLGMCLSGLLFMQSCKKDSPQPETERVKALLKSNTWKMQSVQVDNVDKTSVYAGFTLSFTDVNYSTTNGGGLWPATGTWTFVDDTGKKIKRNDNLEITLVEVTETSLKLSFNWSKTTLGPGRTSSVAGNHTFNMVK